MKQKDIALIAVVVFISAIASFFLSNAVFGSPKSNQVETEVVQPIAATFPKPNKAYFNDKSFDPTQTITIGQNANTDPFNIGGNGNQ